MVLSTSTLSLRFMRNARHVEPEQTRAGVKDDAEWEISQASAPSAYRSEKAVTYETSYLPFLFPSLHDTPAADGSSSLSPSNTLRPRGRRVFNKRGQEITQEASPSSTDTAPQANIDQQAGELLKKTPPLAISSSGVPSLAARHSTQSAKNPSKNARNLIFDMSGVGTDLRHSQGTAFLRPAGVDGPATSNPATTASHPPTGPANPSKPKVKRSRTSGEADESKKKTKLTLIE